jgi:hypothetical protein
MRIIMRNLALLTATAFLASATGAFAQPPSGQTSAQDVQYTTGFVCPVIHTDAVLNSPKGMEIGGGDYSIIGPDLNQVPIGATNANGAGSPGGYHASPGDANYSPIWATC